MKQVLKKANVLVVFFLAMAYDVDPTPVASIESLKREL